MQTLSVRQATRAEFAATHSQPGQILEFWFRVSHAYKSAVVLSAEIALAAASYTLALLAVTQERGSTWFLQSLAQTLGLLILFRFAAAMAARLYRRSLRYASALDLVLILKSVVSSSVFFWLIALWKFSTLAIPAAVFLMDAAILILFWSALHFGGRVVRAHSAAARKAGKPVVIVGAGDAGMQVLRDIMFDPVSAYRPVAIVDDDPLKWKRSFCGVRVEGGTKELARVATRNNAAEILICIPSATRSQMRDILDACRKSDVPVRTLPSRSEVIDGKVSRLDLRRPRIEDLLQRDELEFDVSETRRVVGGKTVLVTGAGGSIGSELCRQIAAGNPHKLLLLDKSENSLFYIHLEMSEKLGPERVRPLLVDLVCAHRMREALHEERIDVIFHAAAHKHVGLLESHPGEAIRNNVIGTRNIAEMALERGVARFVNISTDKAVRPQNYMGLSKKITELYVQELAARGADVRFSSVRFGNVAGSTGSVMRLFWDQIQKGRPVRVSDPRAERYFMTVPEAVHLILRAAALGVGGETFVFDMGEPRNIYELARTMVLFAGLKPDEDLRIEFTGLKSGEKINEELWEVCEHPVPTSCKGISVIPARAHAATRHSIRNDVRRMETFLANGDSDGLLQFVHALFPDFRRTAGDGLPVIPVNEPSGEVTHAGAA